MPLTLRRTDPGHESFATVYDNPQFGKIDVGRITERSGNPDHTNAWAGVDRLGHPARPALAAGNGGHEEGGDRRVGGRPSLLRLLAKGITIKFFTLIRTA